LKELIQAAADAGATAIGVDIDFSLRDGKYVHPDDAAFFTFCKTLSQEKGIPIRLGVYRMQGEPPDAWFGTNAFAELGASIAIPEKVAVPRRLPLWVRAPESNHRLAGMSAALATNQNRSRGTSRHGTRRTCGRRRSRT